MRQALRVLAREKAFAAFAILTLALGIGAVTAIFSVVDGVLLKPLAYREPGRLYAAAESALKLAPQYPRIPVNAAHFRSWQEQCRSCESAALVNPDSFNLTGGGEPERIEGVVCTWPVFQVLGVQTQLGRTFVESDDQPGANRFVVISDSLWRRRLGADPAAVGQSIRLNGRPHIVVGVLRPDFRFPAGNQISTLNRFPKRAEIFKPMGFDWAKLNRIGQFNYEAIVRLRPGANPAQAEAEMKSAVADASRQMKMEVGVHLALLQEQLTGGSRAALTLLLASVGVVLLIVCLNLGNLMLVRAAERSRDGAIRRAMGASTGRLLRPLLLENLLIATVGGALGLLLAYAGVRLLVTAAPVDIPRLDEVRVSLTTLAFAFCISAGCGVLCGILPAIRAARVQPADALRSGSRTTAGRDRLRSREWLVGLQVALSVVLLVIAALLGLSFFRVTNVDRGYRVDRILTADVNLPGARYPKSEDRGLFHQRAIEKLETLPGVRSAALISSLPLKAQTWGDVITREGETAPDSELPLAHFRFVSERYFETMGVALRAGRFPAPADRTRKVAVISENAARRVWPGESPVGKRISSRSELIEVIGVVADVRTESLEKQPPLMVYVPYWDGPLWQGGVWGNATYVLRTAQSPSAMANALRAAVRELDPELPLANVLTMEEITSSSLGARRFQTLLAAVFAGAALLLACLGIYGVISYSVARRTNEMGIRIALGAQSSQVSWLVLRQGVRPVLGGVAAGVAGALAIGNWIRSFLSGAEARDPAAIAAVVLLLLLVAAAAGWVPARRAARIQPMAALREE